MGGSKDFEAIPDIIGGKEGPCLTSCSLSLR